MMILTFADPGDFIQLTAWILTTSSKLCIILTLKSPAQGWGLPPCCHTVQAVSNSTSMWKVTLAFP